MAAREVRLRSSSGDRVLARRAGELLFCDAVAGAPLVAAFRAADDGGGIDAVARLLDETSAGAGSLAMVGWGRVAADGAVRIVVNGDVTVVSDHPSLPRLSGSGAGTWVERSLRVASAPVVIGVATDGLDPSTDLRDGVVRAGGFELVVESLAGVPDLPSPDAVTADQRPDTPAARSGRRSPAEMAEALAAAADPPPPVTATLATPPPVTPPPVTPPPVTPPPVTPPAGRSSAPTVDLPVPRASDPGGAASGTVPARVCPTCGTANRDDADECRRCGTGFTALDPVRLVDRPVWRLVFGDGSERRVERPMVLGRDPDPTAHGYPADAEPVTLDSPTLSAAHLEIRPLDWDLTVTDLGSRNGSFVVTSGDGRLARLDPLVAQRVERGTYVQIGTLRFRVEQGEADPADPLG